ncbi:MAG: hypothetical protein IKP95_02530 [Ruminococcus sp.]|nr:hypothetical protein [Ruminococcus sp.]
MNKGKVLDTIAITVPNDTTIANTTASIIMQKAFAFPDGLYSPIYLTSFPYLTA